MLPPLETPRWASWRSSNVPGAFGKSPGVLGTCTQNCSWRTHVDTEGWGLGQGGITSWGRGWGRDFLEGGVGVGPPGGRDFLGEGLVDGTSWGEGLGRPFCSKSLEAPPRIRADTLVCTPAMHGWLLLALATPASEFSVSIRVSRGLPRPGRGLGLPHSGVSAPFRGLIFLPGALHHRKETLLRLAAVSSSPCAQSQTRGVGGLWVCTSHPVRGRDSGTRTLSQFSVASKKEAVEHTELLTDLSFQRGRTSQGRSPVAASRLGNCSLG